MNRIHTKLHLNSVALIFVLLTSSASLKAQTIAIGAVETGPYGVGSSIAVPVTVNETSGCISKNNTFELYLSNAAGNFGPGEQRIGTYSGFYTTFINGTIPAGTAPGTNYRLQVRSTAPVVISTLPGAIRISSAAIVSADITTTIEEIGPDIFGICQGRSNVFEFTDQSTPGSIVTASIKDGLSGAAAGSLNFTSGAVTFPADTRHYTISARAEKGGVISTKGYFLINNLDRTPFSTTGASTICVGGSLSYGINAAELSQNFPGNSYRIDWGDGTIESYTFCELATRANEVSHVYSRPSCGPAGIPVRVTTVKPYCGTLSGAVGTEAFVLQQPINSFSTPAGACTNKAFTFTNTSDPGGTATNAANCKDPNARYTWKIVNNATGVSIVAAANVPLSYNLNYTFPAKGNYTIILTSTNESPCPANVASSTICIQDEPQPSFTIPETLVCKDYRFKPDNTSIFDDPCSTPNLYNWSVTGPTGGVQYVSGNAQSFEPEWKLTKAGSYAIQLTIATPSCGNYTTPTQTIVVNDDPVATLSPDKIFCGTGTFQFNTTATDTRVTLTGTTNTKPTTYTWSVTSDNGGTYNFVSGTANSRYPSIQFNNFDRYTVSVTHTNNCSTATDSQVLDFRRSPEVDAGTYTAICAGASVNLNGSVTYNNSTTLPSGYSYSWIGGSGTFSPNRSTLNAVYTPVASEYGTMLSLTLRVVTTNPSPCNIVTDEATITIRPRNTGTNTTQTICSGERLNFIPASSISGSTFTWTASGNAAGYTASGSGTIGDVLTNTTTADVSVTYTITPSANGCAGDPFTLIVTVKPAPSVTLPADFAICNNRSAGITFTSNLTGNRFKWTSTILSGTLTGNGQQTTLTSSSSINDVLLNTGTAPAKVQYSITPVSADNCTGEAKTVVVTVQPNTKAATAGNDATLCNASGYKLNANIPGTYETGKWTVVSGNLTGNPFTDDTDPATTVNGLTAGNTYTLKWTLSGQGGCDPKNDEVVITVRPDITTPNPGPDQIFCAYSSTNTTYRLNGNVDASRSYETGKWELLDRPAGSNARLVDATDPQTTIVNLKPGIYKLRYTISNGGICTDKSEEFILNVPEEIKPGTLADDATVCADENDGTLTLRNYAGIIAEWQSALAATGPWTSISHTQNTHQFEDLAATTYYRVKIKSSEPLCADTAFSNVVEILVRPAITQANAGQDGVVCDYSGINNTYTLSANLNTLRSYENGRWTIISEPTGSGASFNDATKANTAIKYLIPGRYTLKWMISNDINCEPTADTVVVNVYPSPRGGDLGQTQQVCQNDSVKLTLRNFTGAVLRWESSPTGTGAWTAITHTDSVYAFAAPAQTTFYRAIVGSSGAPVCVSQVPSSVVKIEVSQTSLAGTLRGDSAVCAGTNSGTLTLTGYRGDIKRWEKSTGADTTWTSINNLNQELNFTDLAETTKFRVVVKNGTCPEVFTAGFTVTVNPAVPAAQAGTDKILCNQTSYTLEGNDPGTFSGMWTLTSGQTDVSFIDATKYNTRVNGLQGGEVYEFRWTISGTSPCPAKYDDVKITIRPAITAANAGADATVCDNSATANTSYTLSANTDPLRAAYESGRWSIVSQPAGSDAFFTDATKANTSIRSLIPGRYELKWAISNGITGCTPSFDVMVINVYAMPVGGSLGEPLTVCEGNQVTLTLQNYSGIIMRWESSPAATGPWTSIADTNATYSFQAPSETTFYRAIVGSYGTPACLTEKESAPAKVEVSLASKPGTLRGTDAVCKGTNSGTLTLSEHRGVIKRWEKSVDDGVTWTSISNLNAELNFTDLTQTTKYRVAVKNGSCPEVTTADFTVTVNLPVISAQAGADKVLCNEVSYVLQGNDPGTFSGLWTLISSQAGISFTDATAYNTTANGLQPGETYEFRWTISGVSPCQPSRDEVLIRVLPAVINTLKPVAAVCAGQDVSILSEEVSGGDEQNYAYRWESSTDNQTWTAINGASTKNLTANIVTTTWFRRIVTSGSCEQTSVAIHAVVHPLLNGNTISAGMEICNGNQPPVLTGSLPTGGDGNFAYQWQKSEDGGRTWLAIIGASAKDYLPGALTQTTQYRRIATSGACTGTNPSTSNVAIVTVNPLPTAKFDFENDKGCVPFLIDGENVKAQDFADRNGDYIWYANNVEIGRGINFPSYTITQYGLNVEIKLVVTSKFGCAPAEAKHTFTTRQSVAPAFSFTPEGGCGPVMVRFTNTSASLNDVRFFWDFGNGQTSELANPNAVNYEAQRNGRDTMYSITLKAITSNCGEQILTKTITIRPKPVASFSPDKTFGCSPLKVRFSNYSPGTGNTYTFDFGDGKTHVTTDPSNVIHTFTTDVLKTFKVKLTVTNECGSSTVVHDVKVSPNTIKPELLVNSIETAGCAPFTVEFRNNTTGANAFVYDFGDGNTRKSSLSHENVEHTFTRTGVYTVRLSASNGCSDSSALVKIRVYPKPVVKFSADDRDGCDSLTVNFRNQSTDAVSYLWYFGDGTSSDEKNPTHTFNHTQSPYSIKLIVTGKTGCTDTLVYKDYINVLPKPQPEFTIGPDSVIVVPDYTFFFKDRTLDKNDIINWEWDFGDGEKANGENPTHSYTDTGYHQVTMMITNKNGCTGSISKTVHIQTVAGKLYVANAFMPGSSTPEFSVFRVKATGIKEWRMRVFNRWGQLLWESTKLDETGAPTEGWDGTMNGQPAPQGVYVWEIAAQFINGSEWKGMSYDNSSPRKTGVIHLIR